MSTALGLAMQISANTAQLATAVQEVNKRLDEMGSAGKKAADDLGVLKKIEIGKLALGGLKVAADAFISFGTAVVGAAQSVTNFALSVGRELDSLNDVAKRTGISVEALQAYRKGVEESGTNIETLAKALKAMTIAIGEATNDEKARKSFENLGIAFDDLKKQTPTEQFEAIADAIASIGDNSQRAAVLKEIFGKGGFDLGPLLSEGPGALRKMREEAESLGGVISEKGVQSIDRMFDAFSDVSRVIENLVGQVLSEVAAPVAQIAEDLVNVVRQVGAANIATTVAGGLLDFIQLAGNAFFSLARFIEEFVKKYGQLLGIDVTTEQDKQRTQLETEKKQLEAIIDAGGETLVRRLALGVRAVRAGDQERLAEVNRQLAAMQPAADSTLAAMQQSFNNAIQTAETRIAQRANAPRMAAESAVAFNTDTVAGAIEELKNPLNIIARNSQMSEIVEIPR